MERVSVAGGHVDAQALGTGEPILFVHGSILADAFSPLFKERSLAGAFRLITYHREGFAGSTHQQTSLSIEQQAADALAVLRHFDIERTHVVGHSYGGAISLQLALDAPQAVHSLALLEPALLMVPSAETFTKEVGTIAAIYESGDSSSAIAAFLEGVGGPNFKEILEKSLPGGAFENAVADADTFFKIELPALQEWKFTNTEAQRVTAPSLAVLGADSAPMFGEGFALLKDWMPQTEPFVLPGATHFLQMMNPSGMAEALASFFGRHPLAKAG